MGDCSRTLLAETTHCRIERCRCGVLHLTVGPLTLRTTPEVLRSLGHAASDALATLLRAHHDLEPPSEACLRALERWFQRAPDLPGGGDGHDAA